MGWQQSDIDLLAEFYSRDPGPDRRLEIGIARIATMYLNAHLPKGKPAHKIQDALTFDDVWKTEEEKQQSNQSFQAFGMSFGRVKKRG